MDKEILIKRLSIIKLLLKIGIEQSYQNEMIAFFSILSFHDSAEMFLKLGAENHNEKDCHAFMDYWEKFPRLTLKEAMRNLNAKRVNLKHKSLIPAKIEIESARVNITDFFNQNTPILFGIEFSDISLFDLIKFENVKQLLTTSQKALIENRIEDCIEEVTKAFYELLYSYKASKMDWTMRTHFDLFKTIRSNNTFEANAIEKHLNETIKVINENFQNIEKAFEVISLGLDYRKYVKFKILTPVATRLSNGKYVLEIMGDKNWSKENCQFLIDFVLECSLKLQEFDFDFDSLDTTKFEIFLNKED